MGGKNAGRDAANAANKKVDEAIAELQAQFGETQGTFQPFVDVASQGLAGITQGASLGGLGDRLSEIFGSGALDPLIAERTRATQGQLAAGGLTRSGTAVQEIAGIPQELGLAIEQLLTGRQQDLTNLGFTATQNVGQLGAAKSAGVATGLTQQGQNTSSGILAFAKAKAAGIGSAFNLASSFAFSDPRLKTNVVQVSTLGDLGVYQWDWIEGAKGTSIESQPTLGFMADEVEKKYPAFSGELLTWKGIFYGPLLEHLKDKFHIQETEPAFA